MHHLLDVGQRAFPRPFQRLNQLVNGVNLVLVQVLKFSPQPIQCHFSSHPLRQFFYPIILPEISRGKKTPRNHPARSPIPPDRLRHRFGRRTKKDARPDKHRKPHDLFPLRRFPSAGRTRREEAVRPSEAASPLPTTGPPAGSSKKTGPPA